jgi:hypothetical protein
MGSDDTGIHAAIPINQIDSSSLNKAIADINPFLPQPRFRNLRHGGDHVPRRRSDESAKTVESEISPRKVVVRKNWINAKLTRFPA